ncbi:RES family NAD+ phosphorylase [Paracoccus ravus]|uniref:RES family NAD+ phosphorylase n=1 Tax=Paracoccus ravus TaxID=2447760 RepID=UPI00106DFBA3|nr:RES domain-containing protein [Paracoccus ravus]
MTHRRFDAERRAWRIGDPAGRYPIWSDAGALRHAGRWHRAGDPVIYASEHFSTAMLEKLVHFAGLLPANQHAIEIRIPAGISYEVFADHQAPDWRSPGSVEAAEFGHLWAQERRSAVLLVPSALAPVEFNLLFNTGHPEFSRILPGLEVPIAWDRRLLP